MDGQSRRAPARLTIERVPPSAKRPTTSQVPGAPQLTSTSSLRPGATSTSRQPEPFHRSTWAPVVSDELPTATQLSAEAQSTAMQVPIRADRGGPRAVAQHREQTDGVGLVVVALRADHDALAGTRAADVVDLAEVGHVETGVRHRGPGRAVEPVQDRSDEVRDDDALAGRAARRAPSRCRSSRGAGEAPSTTCPRSRRTRDRRWPSRSPTSGRGTSRPWGTTAR